MLTVGHLQCLRLASLSEQQNNFCLTSAYVFHLLKMPTVGRLKCLRLASLSERYNIFSSNVRADDIMNGYFGSFEIYMK